MAGCDFKNYSFVTGNLTSIGLDKSRGISIKNNF